MVHVVPVSHVCVCVGACVSCLQKKNTQCDKSHCPVRVSFHGCSGFVVVSTSNSVCGAGLAKHPDIPLLIGRDREQVGDEATGGKRTRGPSNKDIATQIPSTLSQCGVPTLE